MPAAPATVPVFDPAAAYPEIADVVAALSHQDRPTVRRVCQARGWAGRSLLAEGVGRLPSGEHLLPATARQVRRYLRDHRVHRHVTQAGRQPALRNGSAR